MKRIATLIDKLKVCKYWLVNHGNVLIESCHYCNSTHIQKLGSTDANNMYLATYKCLNCGATADVKETWNKANKD